MTDLVTTSPPPLPALVQERLNGYASRLNRLSRTVAVNLWKMGEILAEAQAQLADHHRGSFQKWVKQGAKLSYSMAYRLINVYNTFSYSSLERLGAEATALYMLSEPATSKEAREEALWRSEQGETITYAKAKEIVESYRPLAPSLPPLPPLPPKPPTPEYQDFERNELLTHLHDAGFEDAPQLLSGKREEPPLATEEMKEQAKESLRGSITEVVRGVDTTDEDALNEAIDEILSILGQGSNSISVAMHFGVALAGGPLTLADLVELSATVCGKSVSDMERGEYLDHRKRVLRLLDGLSFGGCGVYEHRLSSGQLVYGLMPCEGEIGS